MLFAKNEKKEIKKEEINPTQETKAPTPQPPKKNLEKGESGVSYFKKSSRKAKEPHKNTKASGPMDTPNKQGEGLQNVNGSRE